MTTFSGPGDVNITDQPMSPRGKDTTAQTKAHTLKDKYSSNEATSSLFLGEMIDLLGWTQIIKTQNQDQTQSSKQHFMLETTNNIITATERRAAESIWK